MKPEELISTIKHEIELLGEMYSQEKVKSKDIDIKAEYIGCHDIRRSSILELLN